jgi:hypothetical protein
MKPLGSMSNTIDRGFGFTFAGAHNFEKTFSLGLDLSYTNYGWQRDKQLYTFDDGSVTETFVVVNNYFLNLNVTGKLFLRNGKGVNPYLSGKLGYAWFRTELDIEDPEDVGACEPLESHVLSKDGTPVITGGAGVRIDLSSVVNSVESDKYFFELNTHLTQGGNVKYMNVDHHPEQQPDSDVMGRFINRQTQIVHEHHIGYLYSSFVNMMEFRLSVIVRP